MVCDWCFVYCDLCYCCVVCGVVFGVGFGGCDVVVVMFSESDWLCLLICWIFIIGVGIVSVVRC